MGESDISDTMSMSGDDYGEDCEPKRSRMSEFGYSYVPAYDGNDRRDRWPSDGDRISF